MAIESASFDHLGFRYDTKQIVSQLKDGTKLPDAIRRLYPATPTASIPHIATKVRKQPYFIAYKEAKTEILNNAGPDLQQNMLDLAFKSRSEMVRFSATDAAMKRVYGNETEEQGPKPTMVFNFSFGAGAPSQPDTKVIIDGDKL